MKKVKGFQTKSQIIIKMNKCISPSRCLNIQILRKEKREMSYEDIKAKKKSVSPLMSDGKTQIHTADIENQILTVTRVDSVETRNGRCGVMAFREYPGNY